MPTQQPSNVFFVFCQSAHEFLKMLQNIIIYTLENGAYELFGKGGIGETAKSNLLKGFEVSIDEIMA
jgi:hypothetical protein